MKRTTLIALTILLASCGKQGINVGQGFEMTPSFDDAAVAANVVNVYAKNADGTRGAYLYSDVKTYTVTEGKLNILVRAGSLGMTVKQINVKYTDASGNPFGDASSTFNISAAFDIPGGYVCKSGADACDFVDKTPQNVAFSKTTDQYNLSEQIAVAAASTCVDDEPACSEVRMNMTLTGTDTLGQARSINIPQAQIRVYIASVTDEVQ
ncbi:hypothetical protein [Deinococcus sp. PEB2-63]